MMRRLLVVLALILSSALPSQAQILTLSGKSISLAVSLPGGIGADVSLSFEDVTGLNLLTLGASAQLINPNDPALLARLPASVTPALPLLLRIEPPLSGPLSFRGISTLEIHTHNLVYVPTTPLRLYHAPLGGRFEDMTAFMGSGSYRVRGTSGGFSEFLIVSDTRTVDQAITDKFDDLEDELDEYSGLMPASLASNLATILATARADYARGALSSAIQGVDSFQTVVQQNSGTNIPNVWRAARDVENAAGYLRAGAKTLRFSLALKSDLGL
jgi:hypothetical protein